MSENIEIRRIMVLNAVNTGIFSILKVIPEYIENVLPISERVTEITIKNFKGIKEVRMGPIKPINVLIGRNNSGKSSILALAT